MRPVELGPLSLTLIASLVLAVVLLLIRIFVMQRVQRERQRENRQETERLRHLVTAYRSLAGSFGAPGRADLAQIEEALADIILFGSIRQVELAAECAAAIGSRDTIDYQPLIDDLRTDLRAQLGLDAIPAAVRLPRSGPSRASGARAARDERGRGGRGGESGLGGGAGGGAAVGGVGLGLAAGEDRATRDP
jgi:uncharacterized membrane protein YgcG